MSLELYQFAFSHYNEKARWALDYKNLPCRRHNLLLGPHAEVVSKISGQRQVPLLVDDGQPIVGSARIVEWLDQKSEDAPLMPNDPALAAQARDWITWLDDEVGVDARLAFFLDLFEDPELAGIMFTMEQPDEESALFKAQLPNLIPLVREILGITPEKAEMARERLNAALSRIAEATADTGYLVGDRFSAADLTAASLLFLLFVPEEVVTGILSPRPAMLEEWLDRWSQEPAGAYVRDIYGKHRRPAERKMPK